MMTALSRRTLLALPALAAPVARASARQAIPTFPHWVGRTALLRGEGGAVRLLLAPDGSGVLSVRVLLLCRTLPVRAWQMDEDGLAVRYRRVAATDPERIIPGEARILPEAGQLLWIESRRQLAAFEGFAEPDLAGRCG